MNLPIQQSTLSVIFSRRMLVAFLMGFSGGLPLLLTWGVLQAWMTEKGVDLTWIGMISLVQIPYSLFDIPYSNELTQLHPIRIPNTEYRMRNTQYGMGY